MKLHNILSYLFLTVSYIGESFGEKINITINCAEGYYLKPHPYKCREYYLCTSYGPKKMTCPIGKVFDQIRYTCLPEYEAVCKIEHDVVISEDKKISAVTAFRDFTSSHHPENETTIASTAAILSSTTTVKDTGSSLMSTRGINDTIINSINITSLYTTTPLSETAVTKNVTTPTIKSQPNIPEISTSTQHYHIENITNSQTTYQMHPSSTTRNITSYSTNKTYTPVESQSNITGMEKFNLSHYDTINTKNYYSIVTASYPAQEDKIIFTHQPTYETSVPLTINQSQATDSKNFTSPSLSYHTTNTISTSTKVTSYPSTAKEVIFSQQPIDPTTYTSSANQTNPITAEFTSPSYTENATTYISTVDEWYSSHADKTIIPQQPTNATSFTSTIHQEYPSNAENSTSSPSHHTIDKTIYNPAISESYTSIEKNFMSPNQADGEENYTSTVHQPYSITAENITSPNYVSTLIETPPSLSEKMASPHQSTNATSYTSTVIEHQPITTEIQSSQNLYTANTTSTTNELHPSFMKNIGSSHEQRETLTLSFTVKEPYPTMSQNKTLSPSYHKTNTTAYIPAEAKSYFPEIKTPKNLYNSENPANSTVIQSHPTNIENFRNNKQIHTLSTIPTELTLNPNNLEITKFYDLTNGTEIYSISSISQSVPSTTDIPTTFYIVNKIINNSKPYSDNDENRPITSEHTKTNKLTTSNLSLVPRMNNDTKEQSSTIISKSQPLNSQFITLFPYQSTSVTIIDKPSANNLDEISSQLIQTPEKSDAKIPSILPFLSNSFINAVLSALSHSKLIFVKLTELLFVQ